MSDYLHLKSAAKRVALKDLRWIPLSNYIYCVFFELVSKATDIYCCAYFFELALNEPYYCFCSNYASFLESNLNVQAVENSSLQVSWMFKCVTLN